MQPGGINPSGPLMQPSQPQELLSFKQKKSIKNDASRDYKIITQLTDAKFMHKPKSNRSIAKLSTYRKLKE
jgi:hypothetical protein